MRDSKKNKKKQKQKQKSLNLAQSSGKPAGKGRRPYHIILTIIYFIAMIIFAGMLIWLNFLPMEYLAGALGIILTGSILIALFMNVKKPKSKRRTAGTIIAIVLIIIYGIGMFYIYSTQDMFAKISNIGKATEDYYVIAQKEDSSRNIVDDIQGDDVYIFKSTEEPYLQAQDKLKEKVDINYEKEKNYIKAAKKLEKDECKAIFMSASYYEMAAENIEGFEDDTKIIYTINIVSDVKDIAKAVKKITSEPFNVFISGIDVFGTIDVVSRSDVNMVMTVNPETKTILLTSLPRDSHVMLHSKQAMDKLTHAGIFGINESVATAEDLLQTDINYYLRVNFSTVIDIVDAIDGIDVTSDVAFTTHGRQNTGYSFVEGKNHLDGKAALAFARERYSFTDGDFQRTRNQQKVLKAMLKKCLSSETILTKYTKLLDAVEDEMQTNLTTGEIQELVKMQVRDMDDWNIILKSVSGTTGPGSCYAAGGATASCVFLDQADLQKSINKIQMVMSGSKGADNEWTWDYDKKVKKDKAEDGSVDGSQPEDQNTDEDTMDPEDDESTDAVD